MAVKEEKIAVAKLLTGIDDYGSAQLDYFKFYTRKEAIERMKNADIKKHWECQKEGRRPTDDETYSAMLDALLEGK